MPALTGDITTPGGSLATTLKNTGTAGTYTKPTFDAQGRETSGAAAVLASADYANQGTTTTVLHGNASGNPSFALVSLSADVTGTLPTANLPAQFRGLAGSCSTGNSINSTVHYMPVFGASGNFSITFSNACNYAQGPITFSNLCVTIDNPVPITGTNTTIAIYTNTSAGTVGASALTVTLIGNSSNQDTNTGTLGFTVPAGIKFAIGIVDNDATVYAPVVTMAMEQYR